MIKCKSGKCYDDEAPMHRMKSLFDKDNIADMIDLDLVEAMV